MRYPTPPLPGPYPLSFAAGGSLPPAPLVTQSQTAGIENADRVARFQRLAGINNVTAPLIEQLYAPAGTDRDITGQVPVVRVVFQEQVFFDTGIDVPRAQCAAILDMIAGNMRGDVRDAQVTVLGHTDAVGGDDYNMAL